MKITKTASGKQTIKISKKEWQSIGKKAGWMKKAEDEWNVYPNGGEFKREKSGYVAGVKYQGSEQLMDIDGNIMHGYGKETKVFSTTEEAQSALDMSEYSSDPSKFIRPYYREISK